MLNRRHNCGKLKWNYPNNVVYNYFKKISDTHDPSLSESRSVSAISAISDSDGEDVSSGMSKTDFSATQRNVSTSSQDEVNVLRNYRVRKAKTTIKKCKQKGLRFSKRICALSSDIFHNPAKVTDAELKEVSQVCIEALGSDFDMEQQSAGSYVSSSSDEERRTTKRLKKEKPERKLFELQSPLRKKRIPDSRADFYSNKTRMLSSLGTNTLYRRQQLHVQSQARRNWDSYARQTGIGYGQFEHYSSHPPPQEQGYYDPRNDPRIGNIGNAQFRLNEAAQLEFQQRPRHQRSVPIADTENMRVTMKAEVSPADSQFMTSTPKESSYDGSIELDPALLQDETFDDSYAEQKRALEEAEAAAVGETNPHPHLASSGGLPDRNTQDHLASFSGVLPDRNPHDQLGVLPNRNPQDHLASSSGVLPDRNPPSWECCPTEIRRIIWPVFRECCPTEIRMISWECWPTEIRSITWPVLRECCPTEIRM